MDGLSLSNTKAPLLYTISRFERPFDFGELKDSIFKFRRKLLENYDIDLKIEASPRYSSERALLHIFMYLSEKGFIKKVGEKYEITDDFKLIEGELIKIIEKYYGSEKSKYFLKEKLNL
ncbi:hypothetical protein [Candidatus Pyrohabitans sp.]